MAGTKQKQKNNNKQLQAQMASRQKKTEREIKKIATAEATKKLRG